MKHEIMNSNEKNVYTASVSYEKQTLQRYNYSWNSNSDVFTLEKKALQKFQTNENPLKIVQTSCRYNGSNVTILVDMSILLYGDKFTDRYIKFFADGIF